MTFHKEIYALSVVATRVELGYEIYDHHQLLDFTWLVFFFFLDKYLASFLGS